MQNIIKNQFLFFVSLIGIVLVSSVMATTYAYQALRVDYVSGSKEELTVSSGVLDVTFEVTNKIEVNNLLLLPSYKTSDYIEFIIDNTNSSSEVGYQISLIDLDYSGAMSNEYFRYTLVRINDDNSFEEIGNGSFVNLNEDYIDLYFDNGLYDYIDAGTSYKIRLYIWVKESKNVNQSELLNTYFKGKVNVSSVFSSDVSYEKESGIFEVGTLADKIVSNSMLGINGTVFLNNMTMPAFDSNEVYEATLSTINDSYGTSYYFRGNVIDNYLNFNNKCWRIVRIEGDGSIKLILEDDKNVCDGIEISNPVIMNENGNIVVKNDLLNKNNIDGNLSFELNKWYDINNFLEYSSYLKLDTMCHNGTSSYKTLDVDRNLYTLRSNSNVYGNVNNQFVLMNEDSYKTQCNVNIENNATIVVDDTMYCNEWYYDSYRRLNMDNKEVSLLCNDNEKTDGYVGVLSADEVVLAGYLNSNSNKNYLSNDYSWWTSSVSYQSFDKEFMYYVGDNLLIENKDNTYGIRPTITLVSGIKYVSGDGTISNPYNIILDEKES